MNWAMSHFVSKNGRLSFGPWFVTGSLGFQIRGKITLKRKKETNHILEVCILRSRWIAACETKNKNPPYKLQKCLCLDLKENNSVEKIRSHKYTFWFVVMGWD